MISRERQCELLGLARSSYYYKGAGEDGYNLHLMRLIDEQYTKAPFYGVERMTAWLRSRGYRVNPKRVRRLMRRMALEAIYPRKRRSFSSPGHKLYPYLLSGLKIDRPDQVWEADITYIRLARGFLYLTAVMDCSSRYVLSWELANSLTSDFCVQALREALRQSQPEILNTDQGVQFTSQEFNSLLEGRGIRRSMDSRGRVYDNIFVERLWRTVKYEEVYLHEYETVAEARERLGAYFRFYNEERLHQALGYRTPHEVYFGLPSSSLRIEAYV